MIAFVGLIVAVTIYLLGRPKLQPPDIERWLANEQAALLSPPLAAAVRGVVNDTEAANAGHPSPRP